MAGTWSAGLLIPLGAVVVGLAVGAATALGWLLWRCRPSLRGLDATSAVPGGQVG